MDRWIAAKIKWLSQCSSRARQNDFLCSGCLFNWPSRGGGFELFSSQVTGHDFKNSGGRVQQLHLGMAARRTVPARIAHAPADGQVLTTAAEHAGEGSRADATTTQDQLLQLGMPPQHHVLARIAHAPADGPVSSTAAEPAGEGSRANATTIQDRWWMAVTAHVGRTPTAAEETEWSLAMEHERTRNSCLP